MARPRRSEQIRDRSDLPICEDQIVHVDAVRETRSCLPHATMLAEMSATFGALSDPTRLRIVAALAIRELCVCDLAASLGVTQSAVSHQLAGLRRLGLVRTRRVSRRVYYALDDEHVSHLYSQALDHIRHRAEEPA